MKDVYPEYAEQVNFYAVGTFSKAIESIEKLESYRVKRGHPWPVANPASSQILADLNVTIQSTKIAFDSRGVIIYRDGFGKGDPATWRQVFMELAQPQ